MHVRPIRVYVDCCLDGRKPWQVRRRFLQVLQTFEQTLTAVGIETLNFSTLELPFDPYVARNSIDQFVTMADALVALVGDASDGFSTFGRTAVIDHNKPRFLFVPHYVDLCRMCEIPYHPYYRVLFCTEQFPAHVLKQHCVPRPIQTAA